MLWASALSESPSLDDAVEEVTEKLREDLNGVRPDLVVAFAAAEYDSALVGLPAALVARLGTTALIGCTGGGVIAEARELEAGAGLSVVAAVTPDVHVQPFLLGATPERWRAEVGTDPDLAPHLVVLPEPYTCDTPRLLRWFDETYPHSTKIGGLASGGKQPGTNALFCGDRAYAGGAVGLALTGDIAMDTVVAQGCRPIGTPLFVTKCQRNVVLELDGRPAVSVIQELYEQLPREDQQLFRSSLFLGAVMRRQESYGRGDFVIRSISGIDQERSAVLVGASLVTNQVVQFHLRDAGTSAEDIGTMLARRRAETGDQLPSGALQFTCLGRGASLYGEPDFDSRALEGHFGSVPTGGFFCNGEIGPVGGRTFLHTYTSSFALFRARGPLA